jgi:hypothetical protein
MDVNVAVLGRIECASYEIKCMLTRCSGEV